LVSINVVANDINRTLKNRLHLKIVRLNWGFFNLEILELG
jgi:hypothetical protein